ncbi:hypothetical protein ACO0LF_03850 [Undibacterium sp. Di27W]|uniref:hypothetical protein n=1 Tax=Undibacterium sp. Di27W TaxID=3413036 RepID=UPI003BF28427
MKIHKFLFIAATISLFGCSHKDVLISETIAPNVVAKIEINGTTGTMVIPATIGQAEINYNLKDVKMASALEHAVGGLSTMKIVELNREITFITGVGNFVCNDCHDIKIPMQWHFDKSN